MVGKNSAADISKSFFQLTQKSSSAHRILFACVSYSTGQISKTIFSNLIVEAALMSPGFVRVL